VLFGIHTHTHTHNRRNTFAYSVSFYLFFFLLILLLFFLLLFPVGRAAAIIHVQNYKLSHKQLLISHIYGYEMVVQLVPSKSDSYIVFLCCILCGVLPGCHSASLLLFGSFAPGLTHDWFGLPEVFHILYARFS